VWLATGSPPPPDATPPAGLPPALAGALGRSLAADPGARHPDPLAWLADIRSALESPAARTPPGARPGLPPPPPPPPPPPVDAVPTPSPPYPPQEAVPWTGRSVRARGWRPRLGQSAWVLAALPFGLTTWAGFLYVGLRARRPSWLWTAGAYGVGAVLVVVLAVTSPTDADGQADMGAWQSQVGVTMLVVLWFGGLAHALVVNRSYLRGLDRRSPPPT
jgi:hypothetical protein